MALAARSASVARPWLRSTRARPFKQVDVFGGVADSLEVDGLRGALVARAFVGEAEADAGVRHLRGGSDHFVELADGQLQVVELQVGHSEVVASLVEVGDELERAGEFGDDPEVPRGRSRPEAIGALHRLVEELQRLLLIRQLPDRVASGVEEGVAGGVDLLGLSVCRHERSGRRFGLVGLCEGDARRRQGDQHEQEQAVHCRASASANRTPLSVGSSDDDCSTS